jgi:hypothetical protein
MSTNPNEYSIRIILERNDITDDKHFVDRQMVVEKGNVDVNEIVEDMITSWNNANKPL